MEPFLAWPRRKAGLRLTHVSRAIGRNLQFVKDRVARMESDGVIASYRMFPNLRHLGLRLSVFHSPADFVPDKQKMSRLASVDGFHGVVWYLDSGLCINLCHSARADRDRRIRLIEDLVGGSTSPEVLYELTFPEVDREMTQLDWRIVQALLGDARRPLSEVAEELGVTAKTVRSHVNTMWEEGSIDTFVELDFAKASGVIPFQLALWHEPGVEGVRPRVLEHFGDRYLDHIDPPEGAYADFLVRVFAFTPAEVQAIVRDVLALEGVRAAEPQLATGSFWSADWLKELVDTRAEAGTQRLP